MSPVPARYLGAGRWWFRLELGRAPAGPLVAERLALVPRVQADVAVRVETVAPWPDGAGTWDVVVAVHAGPDAQPPEYEVRVDGGPAAVVVRFGDDGYEPAPPAAPAGRPPMAADYTARDYTAVRAAMLRQVAELTGAPPEQTVVPQSVAVVEALAYLADALSYAQDALATEGYLATARRRVSVTRHAVLLGYDVHQGANARTWVRLDVAAGPFVLPAGTPLLTRVAGLATVVSAAAAEAAVHDGALVFETVTDVELHPRVPPVELFDAEHPGRRLPTGATRAVVAGHRRDLRPGSLVLVAAVHPPPAGHVVRLVTATTAHASAGRRQVPVTRLTWAAADALPADPALSGPLHLLPGNLVLVDHGRTVPASADHPAWSVLPRPEAGRRYWPVLPEAPVTFAAAVDPDLDTQPAAWALRPAGPTLAAVEVVERLPGGTRRWTVCRTLLDSGPLAADVVVEVDDAGQGRLRFGDGRNGLRPRPGAELRVRHRVGLGTVGNVSAYALGHVVGTDLRVTGVANPVAAAGGRDPEPVRSVQLHAPRAGRDNDRAVTLADYARYARQVRGVHDVSVAAGSTGAAPLVVVSVHSGWPQRADVLNAVRRALADRHVAGVVVDVRPAVAMPVGVQVDVRVAPGWSAAAVRAGVDRALRSTLLRPGRFGFGDPLYRSDVALAVTAVAGVADAVVTRFAPAGATGADAPEVLRPRPGQVLRMADLPEDPAAGWVRYRLLEESAP